MNFDLTRSLAILERTPGALRALLATWPTHGLGRLAQIARVVARQYREAVGPGRTCLPLLDSDHLGAPRLCPDPTDRRRC